MSQATEARKRHARFPELGSVAGSEGQSPPTSPRMADRVVVASRQQGSPQRCAVPPAAAAPPHPCGRSAFCDRAAAPLHDAPFMPFEEELLDITDVQQILCFSVGELRDTLGPAADVPVTALQLIEICATRREASLASLQTAQAELSALALGIVADGVGGGDDDISLLEGRLRAAHIEVEHFHKRFHHYDMLVDKARERLKWFYSDSSYDRHCAAMLARQGDAAGKGFDKLLTLDTTARRKRTGNSIAARLLTRVSVAGGDAPSVARHQMGGSIVSEMSPFHHRQSECHTPSLKGEEDGWCDRSVSIAGPSEGEPLSVAELETASGGVGCTEVSMSIAMPLPAELDGVSMYDDDTLEDYYFEAQTVQGIIALQSLWRGFYAKKRFREVLPHWRSLQRRKKRRFLLAWRNLSAAQTYDAHRKKHMTFDRLLGHANIKHINRIFACDALLKCRQRATTRTVFTMWHRYTFYMKSSVDKVTGLRGCTFEADFPLWDAWVKEDAERNRIRDKVATLSFGDCVLMCFTGWAIYTSMRSQKRQKSMLARAHYNYTRLKLSFMNWLFLVMNKSQLEATTVAMMGFYLDRWKKFIASLQQQAHTFSCIAKVSTLKAFSVWRKKADRQNILRMAGMFWLMHRLPLAYLAIAMISDNDVLLSTTVAWKRWRDYMKRRGFLIHYIAKHSAIRCELLMRLSLRGWYCEIFQNDKRKQHKVQKYLTSASPLFTHPPPNDMKRDYLETRNNYEAFRIVSHVEGIHASLDVAKQELKTLRGGTGRDREGRTGNAMLYHAVDRKVQTSLQKEVPEPCYMTHRHFAQKRKADWRRWNAETRHTGDCMLFLALMKLLLWYAQGALPPFSERTSLMLAEQAYADAAASSAPEAASGGGVRFEQGNAQPAFVNKTDPHLINDPLVTPLSVTEASRKKREKRTDSTSSMGKGNAQEEALLLEQQQAADLRDAKYKRLEESKLLLSSLGSPFFDSKAMTVNVGVCLLYFEEMRRNLFILLYKSQTRGRVILHRFNAQRAALRIHRLNPYFTVDELGPVEQPFLLNEMTYARSERSPVSAPVARQVQRPVLPHAVSSYLPDDSATLMLSTQSPQVSAPQRHVAQLPEEGVVPTFVRRHPLLRYLINYHLFRLAREDRGKGLWESRAVRLKVSKACSMLAYQLRLLPLGGTKGNPLFVAVSVGLGSVTISSEVRYKRISSMQVLQFKTAFQTKQAIQKQFETLSRTWKDAPPPLQRRVHFSLLDLIGFNPMLMRNKNSAARKAQDALQAQLANIIDPAEAEPPASQPASSHGEDDPPPDRESEHSTSEEDAASPPGSPRRQRTSLDVDKEMDRILAAEARQLADRAAALRRVAEEKAREEAVRNTQMRFEAEEAMRRQAGEDQQQAREGEAEAERLLQEIDRTREEELEAQRRKLQDMQCTLQAKERELRESGADSNQEEPQGGAVDKLLDVRFTDSRSAADRSDARSDVSGGRSKKGKKKKKVGLVGGGAQSPKIVVSPDKSRAMKRVASKRAPAKSPNKGKSFARMATRMGMKKTSLASIKSAKSVRSVRSTRSMRSRRSDMGKDINPDAGFTAAQLADLELLYQQQAQVVLPDEETDMLLVGTDDNASDCLPPDLDEEVGVEAAADDRELAAAAAAASAVAAAAEEEEEVEAAAEAEEPILPGTPPKEEGLAGAQPPLLEAEPSAAKEKATPSKLGKGGARSPGGRMRLKGRKQDPLQKSRLSPGKRSGRLGSSVSSASLQGEAEAQAEGQGQGERSDEGQEEQQEREREGGLGVSDWGLSPDPMELEDGVAEEVVFGGPDLALAGGSEESAEFPGTASSSGRFSLKLRDLIANDISMLGVQCESEGSSESMLGPGGHRKSPEDDMTSEQRQEHVALVAETNARIEEYKRIVTAAEDMNLHFDDASQMGQVDTEHETAAAPDKLLPPFLTRGKKPVLAAELLLSLTARYSAMITQRTQHQLRELQNVIYPADEDVSAARRQGERIKRLERLFAEETEAGQQAQRSTARPQRHRMPCSPTPLKHVPPPSEIVTTVLEGRQRGPPSSRGRLESTDTTATASVALQPRFIRRKLQRKPVALLHSSHHRGKQYVSYIDLTPKKPAVHKTPVRRPFQLLPRVAASAMPPRTPSRAGTAAKDCATPGMTPSPQVAQAQPPPKRQSPVQVLPQKAIAQQSKGSRAAGGASGSSALSVVQSRRCPEQKHCGQAGSKQSSQESEPQGKVRLEHGEDPRAVASPPPRPASRGSEVALKKRGRRAKRQRRVGGLEQGGADHGSVVAASQESSGVSSDDFDDIETLESSLAPCATPEPGADDAGSMGSALEGRHRSCTPRPASAASSRGTGDGVESQGEGASLPPAQRQKQAHRQKQGAGVAKQRQGQAVPPSQGSESAASQGEGSQVGGAAHIPTEPDPDSLAQSSAAPQESAEAKRAEFNDTLTHDEACWGGWLIRMRSLIESGSAASRAEGVEQLGIKQTLLQRHLQRACEGRGATLRVVKAALDGKLADLQCLLGSAETIQGIVGDADESTADITPVGLRSRHPSPAEPHTPQSAALAVAQPHDLPGSIHEGVLSAMRSSSGFDPLFDDAEWDTRDQDTSAPGPFEGTLSPSVDALLGPHSSDQPRGWTPPLPNVSPSRMTLLSDGATRERRLQTSKSVAKNHYMKSRVRSADRVGPIGFPHCYLALKRAWCTGKLPPVHLRHLQNADATELVAGAFCTGQARYALALLRSLRVKGIDLWWATARIDELSEPMWTWFYAEGKRKVNVLPAALVGL